MPAKPVQSPERALLLPAVPRIGRYNKLFPQEAPTVTECDIIHLPGALSHNSGVPAPVRF